MTTSLRGWMISVPTFAQKKIDKRGKVWYYRINK